MAPATGAAPVVAGPGAAEVIRFELTAAPRSQQELTLAYAVSSSAKVSGL